MKNTVNQFKKNVIVIMLAITLKTAVKKVVVVIRFNAKSKTPDFIINAQHIHDMLLGNPEFADVQTLLPQLQTDINTLMGDESKAKTKVVGASATVTQQKGIIYNQVELIKATVQKDVNLPANINNAVAMVNGTGMFIKGHTPPTIAPLHVKHGETTGSVILIAKSVGHHAAYEWQESKDGINFVDCSIRVTLETHNPLSGFTPATTWYFRTKPVLPAKAKTGAKGEGNWSSPVSIVII
jgi:hypothetical protein